MPRRFVLLMALALFTLPASMAPPESTTQAQGCVFQLGFQTLRSMIPEIVGDCRENEWHNAVNGDGLQQTTGGLLGWRKCDNWTAFTNGSITWINGPSGLVTRPNAGPLFPFESSTCGAAGPPALPPPGPPAPPPPPAPSGDAPPVLKLTLSDDRIGQGDTFTITLEANDDKGVDSMWWWATSTDDNDMRNTHSFDCNGATPCRNSWDRSTNDTGTNTIHAQAKDTAGQVAGELTWDIKVREPGDTPTPTPTKTATATPTKVP